MSFSRSNYLAWQALGIYGEGSKAVEAGLEFGFGFGLGLRFLILLSRFYQNLSLLFVAIFLSLHSILLIYFIFKGVPRSGATAFVSQILKRENPLNQPPTKTHPPGQNLICSSISNFRELPMTPENVTINGTDSFFPFALDSFLFDSSEVRVRDRVRVRGSG